MNEYGNRTEVARLYFEVGKILRHSVRRTFEDIGITMPQSAVIGTLIKHGEMKISDLSTKVNLSMSTVSGIIDRLERDEFVVRTRSNEDRRSVYVKITPKVEEIHKGIHGEIEKSFEDLLSAGTPDEIDKIVEGLNILKKILQSRKE